LSIEFNHAQKNAKKLDMGSSKFYLCNVFFMVLDFKVNKLIVVVGRQPFLFL